LIHSDQNPFIFLFRRKFFPITGRKKENKPEKDEGKSYFFHFFIKIKWIAPYKEEYTNFEI